MDNVDKLNSLENGVKAMVRTGRHGRNAIEWSEPFEAVLYLQKDRAGKNCVVALKDQDFAEFDPRRDVEGENLLISEDYALEIIQVPLEG
jgi:hypothetical protein